MPCVVLSNDQLLIMPLVLQYPSRYTGVAFEIIGSGYNNVDSGIGLNVALLAMLVIIIRLSYHRPEK